ncbi:MAG TPA: glycosyltransferase N-terminal domain-containing protein [Bdellovibrionota bacterium]|jgi:3-deoxy-D-manno-octulosonic-acid transferase|nr:glycosyltransferase N-terminal domain-containing protein [Bdellovibrionota bacterium]
MNALRKELYQQASSLLFKGVRFADRNFWMPTQVSETINFRSRWKSWTRREGQAKLWIHGASVGELEDLAAFFLSDEALALAGLSTPDLIITSASVSTESRLKKWAAEKSFLYCGPLPPDTKTDAAKFLSEFRPQNFLLSHNDFWPNAFLQWRGSSYAENFYWYFKPKVFSPSRLELFGAMRPIYLGRSPGSTLFADTLDVGNLRLDRVLSRISAARENAHVLDEWNATPPPGTPSILVGSCRLEDAQLIAKLDDAYFDAYHWIVLPHHTDNIAEVARINELIGQRCRVVVTQGILVEAYKNFDLAWVGGGFSKSGSHNVLEAIAWGIPTICGPNLAPQIDAPDYVAAGALTPLADFAALDAYLRDKSWITRQSEARAFAARLAGDESRVRKLAKILAR